MKATREQCLAMASEVGFIVECSNSVDGDEVCYRDNIITDEIERLVHLAQQFTLDQIRARGADYYVEATPLFDVPETLE